MTRRALLTARLRELGWFLLSAMALASPSGCSPAADATPGGNAVAGTQGQAGGQGLGGSGGAASAGSASTAGATGSTVHGARRYGTLGIGCTVKNDCANGLSCVQGVCQPSSFGLTPSGKECVQIDCEQTTDCCRGLTSEIPDKCRARASTCMPQLPGCVAKACSRAGDCANGGACVGRCGVTQGECRGNVDCLANKCVDGTCTLNFTACGSDAECAANTCAARACACENPNYSPMSPICSDHDCDGLCLWACEDSRCVIPSSCSQDDECVGATPSCVDGKCVECRASADCSFDKICVDGSCQTPCQGDAQCGLFEACQAGECVYVGCRSQRECTLVPDVRSLGLTPGLDPRLLRCHTENGVGRCLIPCQTDSQCSTTEVCSGGLCQYIGCDDSAECASILGVHQQTGTDAQPWIPSVECRAAQ